MPSEVNDDDEVASSAVPWIPAGWRRFRTVVAVLQRLQDAHRPMSTAAEVRAMARRMLRQERVDLLGEPNRGLQVMGLTETRALDFDRVIVLDMNEGTVPQTSRPDSFLPLDLRSRWAYRGRGSEGAVRVFGPPSAEPGKRSSPAVPQQPRPQRGANPRGI